MTLPIEVRRELRANEKLDHDIRQARAHKYFLEAEHILSSYKTLPIYFNVEWIHAFATLRVGAEMGSRKAQELFTRISEQLSHASKTFFNIKEEDGYTVLEEAETAPIA